MGADISTQAKMKAQSILKATQVSAGHSGNSKAYMGLNKIVENFFATTLPILEGNKQSVFDPARLEAKKQGVELLQTIVNDPNFSKLNLEEKVWSHHEDEGGGVYHSSFINGFLGSLGIKDKSIKDLIKASVTNPEDSALLGDVTFKSLPKDKLSNFVQNEITIADEAKKATEEKETEATPAEEASYSEVQAEITRAIEEAIAALPSDADANDKQLAQQTATENVLSEFSMAA